MLNEVGTIRAEDIGKSEIAPVSVSASYWNLSAAVYAYLYAQLAQLGIDVVGESQLIGYPTQFPSVSMLDWTTGRPNARYWVLKLLHDNFGPGDRLVDTKQAGSPVYAQGFITGEGKRDVLLVNKRDRTIEILVPGSTHGQMNIVDQSVSAAGPVSSELASDHVMLPGFAVAVITLREPGK